MLDPGEGIQEGSFLPAPFQTVSLTYESELNGAYTLCEFMSALNPLLTVRYNKNQRLSRYYRFLNDLEIQ